MTEPYSSDQVSSAFDYPARDAELIRRLEKIVSSQPPGEVLKHWPAYVQRRFLPRFLAHYELFKKILDVPGCIIELGVYRGASFFTWASLLETFLPCDRSRRVYGFDHFDGLRPEHFQSQDASIDGRDGKSSWAYKADAELVRSLTQLHNDDNLLPGIERCALVEGDVFETVPLFLEANPGLRISLLHFDLDLYGPTKFCLEHLYPLVSPGGIVCLDEYGLVPWEGETRAVDEYFSGNMPDLRKFPFAQAPGAWFVKK